jgi:hypothetical protein
LLQKAPNYVGVAEVLAGHRLASTTAVFGLITFFLVFFFWLLPFWQIPKVEDFEVVLKVEMHLMKAERPLVGCSWSSFHP